MTANILKLIELDEDDGDGDYRLQDQVGFLLRKAHQRHVAIFSARISDLTPPQFAALAKLGEVGEISQNQLGAAVAMDAATIKGVIDRLRGRGLVEVEKDEVDKRRLTVRLTAEGRTAVAALVAEARTITAKTLEPLSPREAKQLTRLLGKIS